MKTVYIWMIMIMVLAAGSVYCADYPPELSGDFSSGEKFYTDLSEDYEEEIIDCYQYNKYWLRYKKKLSVSDYYYLKYQYYHKEYEVKDTYNNICHDLWGNYTFRLSDKVRNRFNLSLRDKNYYDNNGKSYSSIRLKYTLDFDPDQKNDYQIYVQRQWNNYLLKEFNDNTRDKFKIEWEYKVNERLEFSASFQLENQQFAQFSQRSNKYSQNVSLGFNYEL